MTMKTIYSVIYLLISMLILSMPLSAQKSIIAKNAQFRKIGDGFSFTEGPAVDANGDVYFTDQPNNKIIKWSEKSGALETFMSNSGRSNGMYFDNDGNLLSCADMQNQIWAIDKNGNHKVIVEGYEGKLLNGPNDLWITPNGGLYFTDPLYKRDYWERDPNMQQSGEYVYFLSPDYKSLRTVEETLKKPNGIIGTPDGKFLYVADIEGNKTFRYDISANGEIQNKTLFVEMGSDGMTIDRKGNVYLTGEGVTVFNKRGQQIAHIPVDEPWTSNVCFGGKKRNMLFITASESVYGIKMKVKGVK